MSASFEHQVFINCPFDSDYLQLLKPLLFSVRRLGFFPRIASERLNSGEVRLEKIKELVESSKYSIHDLSRSKASKVGEYFRMNMPFELGLDLGCRDYHSNKQFKKKQFLILESERYSTQKALSDLSFADCKSHKNEAEELVLEIRNWFSECGNNNLPSPSIVWDEYNYFYSDLYENLKEKGFKTRDVDRLPISEFINEINEWLLK